ncbi:MAG TPA: sensor histidine kinase, partial [Chloroflexota bacterium]|nr:sensor histidine kinase [Chloroflexota bacterium]
MIQSTPWSVDLALSLAGVVGFAVAWAWLVTRGVNWRPPVSVAISSVLVLTAIAAYYTIALDGSGLGLFMYVGVLVAFLARPRPAAIGIGGVAAGAAVAGWVAGAELSGLGEFVAMLVTIGVSSVFTRSLIQANIKLRAARAEIARLAVNEERLRFARDLHDLLGHSLSAIALKTELARRLVSDDPSRAENEIAETEAMVRQALREVREAVAGYRQPTLDEQLDGAREILAAAGIGYLREGSPGALPPGVESVLAWSVREGITNVVRHSRATSCTVRFTRAADAVTVELVDDGTGCNRDSPPVSAGPISSGLRGLAERVALRGGALATEAPREGGFRLRVTLPLSRNEERATTEGTRDGVIAR